MTSFFQLWKIIENEIPVPENHVAYTAVVLNEWDKKRLLNTFANQIPPDWERRGDHMTINVGPAADGPARDLLGKLVIIEVRAFGMEDGVAAVRVESSCPSVNPIKHITIAVGPGGAAKDANNLKKWQPLEPFKLQGIVKEVEHPNEPRKERPHLPQSAPAPSDPKEFVQTMLQSGKPADVVRRAMAGKFPNLSQAEIDAYVG